MASLSSIQTMPAIVPLPAVDVWQRWYTSWGNVLRSRKESSVDQRMPGTDAVPALQALKHNHTGLLAYEAVMVKQRARQVLAAMRTLDDRLHLVSWRVNADGSILQTGSRAQEDAIQQVRLVRARNYVVACRTRAGELQLSRWDVSNTGAIYLAGVTTPMRQRIQWLELAVLDLDHFVTLVLTEADGWQLALWQLQGEDSFVLLQTEKLTVSAATGCDLGVSPQADGSLALVTLFTGLPTTLSWQRWHYQPGDALTLRATQHLDLPDMVTILATQTNGDQVRAVVQTMTDQLRLVSWQGDVAGETPSCQADQLLREEGGYCTCQPHSDGFVLFYRTPEDDLEIEVWQQQPDGTVTLRAAGHAPTAVGEVHCCDEPLEGNAPFLTTTIARKGEVTLTTWQ